MVEKDDLSTDVSYRNDLREIHVDWAIRRQKVPVNETIYPTKCCALGDKETDKKKKKAEITCHRKLPVVNDRDLPAS